MVRGNREQPRAGRGWSKIWYPGAPGERPEGQESRRKRSFSFESGGSFGYDGGLRFDKRRIPGKGGDYFRASAFGRSQQPRRSAKP